MHKIDIIILAGPHPCDTRISSRGTILTFSPSLGGVATSSSRITLGRRLRTRPSSPWTLNLPSTELSNFGVMPGMGPLILDECACVWGSSLT